MAQRTISTIAVECDPRTGPFVLPSNAHVVCAPGASSFSSYAAAAPPPAYGSSNEVEVVPPMTLAPRPPAVPARRRRHDPYPAAAAVSVLPRSAVLMADETFVDGRLDGRWLLPGYAAAVPACAPRRRVRQHNPYPPVPASCCVPQQHATVSRATFAAAPPLYDGQDADAPRRSSCFVGSTAPPATVVSADAAWAPVRASPNAAAVAVDATTVIPMSTLADCSSGGAGGGNAAMPSSSHDDDADAEESLTAEEDPSKPPASKLPADLSKNCRRRLNRRLARLVEQGVLRAGTTLATQLGQQVLGLVGGPIDPVVQEAAASALLLFGTGGGGIGATAACQAGDDAVPKRPRSAVVVAARRLCAHRGEGEATSDDDGGVGGLSPTMLSSSTCSSPVGGDDRGGDPALLPPARSGRVSPAASASSSSWGVPAAAASRSLSPVADLMERTWAEALPSAADPGTPDPATAALLGRYPSSPAEVERALGLPPISNRARHDFVPPLHGFFDRCLPHDVSAMPGVLGRFETRVLKPHLRVGGICGEVEPVAIARAVEALCGVRVAAISTFRAIHGLAVVRLRDPEREAAVVRRALHQTAWMSQRAIYWVRRPDEADEAGEAGEEEAAACAARRLRLETFAHSMMPGSRLPRRLMTCEEWTDERPASAA